MQEAVDPGVGAIVGSQRSIRELPEALQLPLLTSELFLACGRESTVKVGLRSAPNAQECSRRAIADQPRAPGLPKHLEECLIAGAVGRQTGQVQEPASRGMVAQPGQES